MQAGDVVRMDGFDERVLVHGVVAPDRSRAVFAHVVLDSPQSIPGPRLRLRGLDPGSRYAVRPAMVGGPPSGLVAPAWWGERAGDDAAYPGVVVTGAVLAGAGLAAAVLHPDQALVYLVDPV